jgi:hypothetical protein
MTEFSDSMPNLDHVLADGDWYDQWRSHIDYRGEGNHGPEARQAWLRDLLRFYDQLCGITAQWKTPSQVWAVVDENDSSQDAVYVHTPNPNRTNYPHTFPGVTWGVRPPPWLQSAIGKRSVIVGRQDGASLVESNAIYFLRPSS